MGLSTESSKALSKILASSTKITRIDLSDNNIGNTGMKYITQGLVRNNNIISLNVSSNNITHEGSNYLFFHVKFHASLVDINISNNDKLRKNKISSKGCIELMNLLTYNKVMSFIDVSDN